MRDKTGSTDWDSFDPPTEAGCPRSTLQLPPGGASQATNCLTREVERFLSVHVPR